MLIGFVWGVFGKGGFCPGGFCPGVYVRGVFVQGIFVLIPMKPYIDFNTQQRAKATNDFETDFFKLMNNSVFGKMMENIRKYRNIKLVTNKEQYLKMVMTPNFKSGIHFGENLMGCKMGKIKVVMNKLVYLGQAILDLSKIVMHEFHYNYMLPNCGSEHLKFWYNGHRFTNLRNKNRGFLS